LIVTGSAVLVAVSDMNFQALRRTFIGGEGVTLPPK
jgi:hypothetical protein